MSVVCIGAGPAGLTAAYALAKAGQPVTVLEADPTYVGGISRTETYKGFGFDIGGHRFFSKSAEIEALWDEILPGDFIERPRKSRIYYNGKLFAYPLAPMDALRKLGILEAAACVASYAHARIAPVPQPRSFRDWVTNQFGRRLFETFFRTYTEKVWGMSCDEISADWAAQRIKGLSLSKAIWHALRGNAAKAPRAQTVKTLIDRFRYPRRGPGMMWEAAARRIEELGGYVVMGERVVGLRRDQAAGGWIVVSRDAGGREQVRTCAHVISSMPMRELAAAIAPALSAQAADAAAALRYRDFLVVALVVRDRQRFDDNWIYIHDPGVQVGRIQNFKSWSPEMVPDPALNCYGMEYFCFERDALWSMPDADLVAHASRELVKLGLAAADEILDGVVVRQPKAYPVYDDHYARHVATLRDELAARYPGLHLVGRNGMHKYNNQDHAMMTALLTARNIIAGQAIFDVWAVNQDAEYHEEVAADRTRPAATRPELIERLVPMRA